MKNTSLHVSLITSNFNYGIEQTNSNTHTPTKLGATKDQLLAYLEEIGEWQKIYHQNLISTEQTDSMMQQLTQLRENDLLKALDVFSAKEQNISKDLLIKKISALGQSQSQLETFISTAINSESERWDLIKDNSHKQWLLLKRIAISINLFILFLACILGYFLSRWIANPIIALRNFTQKINPNNLRERSPIYTQDEIGELAMSINMMLENLLQAKTQIIEASRLAGIAEIATSIIHNVGNLLNSVNTSVTLVIEGSNQSKITVLPKLYDIFSDNKNNLDDFLNNNERGKLVLPYFQQLIKTIGDEHLTLQKELKHLHNNLTHINQVITSQLSFKMSLGIEEQLELSELIEDSLNVQNNNIEKYNIQIERNYQKLPPISIVKSKILQILINLIKNAVEATIASDNQEKRMIITLEELEKNFIRIIIQDNGVGILKENLDKIFSFGFTTKQNGHGYGIHSCALIAKELGGALAVKSEGLEKGALFILDIPKIKHL